MNGFWPIFFLAVVLKIPVFGALWLVWWASKSPEEDPAEDSGLGPWQPDPPLPRGPRRGPHGRGGNVRPGQLLGVERRGGGAPPGQRRPGFRTAHSARGGES